jgi:hypothetical protein
MRQQLTVTDFKEALNAGNHYGGSYWSTYFVMADSGVIGMQYALDNASRIIEEMELDGEGDKQWQAVAYDVNWEGNVWCDGYNKPIEPSYGPFSG